MKTKADFRILCVHAGELKDTQPQIEGVRSKNKPKAIQSSKNNKVFLYIVF
jgi:hypothetical protein|tara:strand:- start:306 stop:458 length:153 start_codon:yes stop_codon:yes gene_type:complete